MKVRRREFFRGQPQSFFFGRSARRILSRVPCSLVFSLYMQWDELQNTVKMYNAETQAIEACFSLPWPVVYLLGMRGEKCILGGGKLPHLQEVIQPLQDWVHRLRTAFALRDSQQGRAWEPRLYVRNDTWRPPRFQAFEDCLDQMFSSLKTLFTSHTDIPANRYRSRGNINSLDRLALTLMRTGKLTAVRSDKDSVFVVLTEAGKDHLLNAVVGNASEIALYPFSDGHWEELRLRYIQLCRRVACGDTRIFRFLVSGIAMEVQNTWQFQLRSPTPTPVANIEINLKTHKNPPEPRELENNRQNYMRAGQLYICISLQRIIRDSFPWVLRDSRQLVAMMESGQLLVPPGFFLYSADVKRFYPSCRLHELKHAYTHLTGDVAAGALNAFLLDHQLLTFHGAPGVYRRIVGAGMGTASAGELCDANTALRNDRAFLERVHSGAILWYVRFRDDGLFCAPCLDDHELSSIASDFAARGSALQLLLSRTDTGPTVWLDLLLSPHTRISPKVHISTHIKPTNAGHYLSARSYHPKCTVTGWMEAELRRYARNSTDLPDCLLCTRRLEACLARRHYPSRLLQLCGRAEVLWRSRQALLAEPVRLSPNVRKLAPLVLRYHRVWEKLGVARYLRLAQRAIDRAFSPRLAPTLMVAYRKAAPHLYVKVRRIQGSC